jgi:sugar transferase (PEP-CTERM/EpsH1 system associated)
MNILFVCHRIPYPPNKGDKIRSYHILRHLSRRHNIWLACLVDDRKDLEQLDALRPLVQGVDVAVIAPRLKKIFSLQGFFKNRPFSVPYFYDRPLQRRIDHLLDRQTIDCVFCFSSPTAEYVFRSRHRRGAMDRALRIMDFIDMDSEKWTQYARRERPPSSWIYRWEGRTLREYEAKIADEFHHGLLVSRAEANLFREKIPADRVHALGNGVDLEYFSPDFSPSNPMPGHNLVFTGAMDYFPNVEGARWFAQSVFPRIRNFFPDARFVIVGSRPSRGVRELSETIPGVRVTGFVEDVREYIGAADICVVPLRIARGIQNKVLEGMAMGKAVVTTREGFEGIEASPGRDLRVARSGPDFAAHVADLLTYPEKRLEMGKRGREFVERNHSWDGNLAFLETLLARPSSSGPFPSGAVTPAGARV